jgi:hypothetical protein
MQQKGVDDGNYEELLKAIKNHALLNLSVNEIKSEQL